MPGNYYRAGKPTKREKEADRAERKAAKVGRREQRHVGHEVDGDPRDGMTERNPNQ